MLTQKKMLLVAKTIGLAFILIPLAVGLPLLLHFENKLDDTARSMLVLVSIVLPIVALLFGFLVLFMRLLLHSASPLWKLSYIREVSDAYTRGHRGQVGCLSFAQGKQCLYTAGVTDKTIKEWTVEGQLKRTFVGHRHEIEWISMNQEETKLYSCGGNEVVLYSILN